MEKGIFRIVTDRRPPRIFAQATVAALAQLSTKEAPALTSARRSRHLDVDAVLARSLPKVVSEQRPTRVRSKELEAA